MKQKRLQWISFALICLATLVTSLSVPEPASRGLLVLAAGLSGSLFVFCFVPYLRKFYLSELLIITCAAAFVMTVYVNILTLKRPESEWIENVGIVAVVATGFGVPLGTLAFLERRRPIRERTTLVPTIASPAKSLELQRRDARTGLIMHGVSFCWWTMALLHYKFTRFPIVITCMWVLCLGSVFTFWKTYRKLTKAIAVTAPEAPADSSPATPRAPS